MYQNRVVPRQATHTQQSMYIQCPWLILYHLRLIIYQLYNIQCFYFIISFLNNLMRNKLVSKNKQWQGAHAQWILSRNETTQVFHNLYKQFGIMKVPSTLFRVFPSIMRWFIECNNKDAFFTRRKIIDWTSWSSI